MRYVIKWGVSLAAKEILFCRSIVQGINASINDVFNTLDDRPISGEYL